MITMSKSKLRDGMVVEVRSGKRYLVWSGRLNNRDGWMPLDEYNENLMCGSSADASADRELNRSYDIMKIGHHLGVNIFNLKEDYLNIDWFWKRDTYKLTKDEYKFILKLKDVYDCKEFNIYIDEIGYLCVIGYGEKGFRFIEIPLMYYNKEYEVNITFENLDLAKDKIYNLDDVLSNYEVKERDNG